MKTRFACIVGALAFLASVSGQAARAEGLDFSTLNNRIYSYQDIAEAKTHSLSDRQIAKIAKIARLSGRAFRPVAQAVYRGETFTLVAQHYNVKPGDLQDVDRDIDDIAAFQAAYEATGKMGARQPRQLKNGPMGRSDM